MTSRVLQEQEDIARTGGTPAGAGDAPTLSKAARLAVPVGATYVLLLWLLTLVAPESALSEFAIDWMALPAQVFAFVACLHVARRWGSTAGWAHIAWLLLTAAAATSALALVVWNLFEPVQQVPWLAAGDWLYVLQYALLVGALVALYAWSGGEFRSSLAWLDAISILAAVLATVWALIFGPLAPAHAVHAMTWSYAAGYGLSASLLLTSASLVWMRIPPAASGGWIAFLIVATMTVAAWLIGWLASWVSDYETLAYLADFGDLICFVLVGIAALRAPPHVPATTPVEDASRSAFVFVPILAVLVSIALISGLLAFHLSIDDWIEAGLLLICLLLVVTRHGVATREFQRLRQELAHRDGDQRVSELVRQSSDVFVVATESGVVTFASPAAETLLGKPPAALVGLEFDQIFGTDHVAAVRRFLDALVAHPGEPATLELVVDAAGAGPRSIRITGANRLAVPRIRGLTLVVRDISKERTLARQIIDAAHAERLRLAADVHDGVGQELTGIALMLQRLVRRSGQAAPEHRQELLNVVGYVNHAIGAARSLARGLSPLYVVHGSLGRALHALATTESRPFVEVDVDPEFGDRAVNDTVGEHLYRMAAESVQNARRHASCQRISLSLDVVEDRIVLQVRDDGIGFDVAGVAGRGLGLQLLEYRARIIGALVQVQSEPARGTRVTITLRLPGGNRAPGAP